MTQSERIHAETPVVDLHLDLGGIVLNRRNRGEKEILNRYFLDDFKKAGLKFVIAAIFIETEWVDLALKLSLLQIAALEEDVQESEGRFKIVKSEADMDAVLKSDQIGILLSLEGAEPLKKDMSLLPLFKNLGVRFIGLTWSRRNDVADGSYFRDPPEGVKGGLTPIGIQCVQKMEALGMTVDLSHINDPGFSDVLDYYDGLLICSHSNTRVVNAMTRNITDEQITAVANRGGVIGMNGYMNIVHQNPSQQNLETMVDHIDHIKAVTGSVNHIAIGLDLCGLYYDSGKKMDVMDDHKQLLQLTACLLARGYTDEDCQKILGLNALRVIRASLKNADR